MGKFDGLKQTLSKTTSKVKESAVAAAGKLKEVDFREAIDKTAGTIKTTASNLQDSIKNFDAATAKDSVIDMAKKGGQALKQHFEDAKETSAKANSVLKESAFSKDRVLVEDALKMIYLLMLSDGTISAEESERFDSIAADLDPENACGKERIISECTAAAEGSAGSEKLEYINDGIQDALHHSRENGKGTINKKLLLWNLLAVSYSDGAYSDSERAVLRTVNRRMEIDSSVILEMEAAVATVDALLREEADLRKSDKPFSVIDAALKDNEYRRNTIIQSVHELIDD